MQQHPVPQNIASYQFRLIGDMTLKQFLQLLAGGVVAYIFYSTNLINIVKWFFMFISVILGVAFAFLPLEGRPLDQWLMAFIRAIYLPTQFYWKKVPKLPDYLSNAPSLKPPAVQPPVGSVPITSLITPKNQANENNFELTRSKRIEDILDLYKKSPDEPAIPTPTTTTPTSLNPKSDIPASPTGGQNPTSNVKVAIKPVENVSVAGDSPSSLPPTTYHLTPSATPHPTITNEVSQDSKNQNPKSSIQTAAVFNPNLPFPSVSETPNTLIGMVTDHTGKIIENAVIEIKNASGTVRATKTNRLGQFFLATPLADDSYQIEVEKAGLNFPPISLKLEGKIYPPLDIKATN